MDENLFLIAKGQKCVFVPTSQTEYFVEKVLENLLTRVENLYSAYVSVKNKEESRKAVKKSSRGRKPETVKVRSFAGVVIALEEIIKTSNAFGITPVITLIPNRKYKGKELTNILVDIPAPQYLYQIFLSRVNVKPENAMFGILVNIPKGKKVDPPKWVIEYLQEYYDRKLKKKRKIPFKPKKKPISYVVRVLNI